MSKLTKARVAGPPGGSAAAGRTPPALVPSGSIGSNWLYSADSLTETLTRGRGPWSSRSIRSMAGQALTSGSARRSDRGTVACVVAPPSR